MPPTVFPKGVTIHETDKAWDCHVMYEGRGGESYLIDMAGDVVRQWPHTGFPAEMIDPVVNGGKKGHVLLQREPDTFFNETILEMDWDANIVWEYDGSSSSMPFWAFYSSFISSSRRLPNGNTLICEGMHGRIFQVTTDGEIVWEYVNPIFGEWSQHQMNLINFGGRKANWVFRAQPVPNDWLP